MIGNPLYVATSLLLTEDLRQMGIAVDFVGQTRAEFFTHAVRPNTSTFYVDTLVKHPALMSHSLLSDQELEKAGISPGSIRMSVGSEEASDLIFDARQALE